MAADEHHAAVAGLAGFPGFLQVTFEQHVHRLKYQPSGFVLEVDNTFGAKDILALCVASAR